MASSYYLSGCYFDQQSIPPEPYDLPLLDPGTSWHIALGAVLGWAGVNMTGRRVQAGYYRPSVITLTVREARTVGLAGVTL